MPQISFATFMIICPTSFFLGLVFSLFPYDYPLLWASSLLTETHLDNVETHLKLLHNSPNLIVRIMHIITAVGLLGLVIKLYKPSESNMLFDGGSLVLYMIAVVIYMTNIVKGLRIVSLGQYGEGLKNALGDQARADDIDVGTGVDVETGNDVLGREDNLKVLSASNTILALVLVGVLVLQIGQWYAERAEEKEKVALAKQDREKTDTLTVEVKRGDGKKVSKKTN
ncbi:Protein csh3 [Lithohypha guttulata]|uniref:Protein csh3 n=1 Tax=Lithohypha guttulata TaxID=1690604 RepID=A0AAN7T827_9EURO|nr:Protein csh3 [Lithohypha guttulata]KAK5091340.1 Protein csh3 [Lithohypha guttulata]KAK5100356.1 Protein csh3 [Lithohypha guttulata]